MDVHGTRFGTLTYNEQDVVLLDEGLMGFPTSTRFILFPYADQSAFFWLQSVDEPEIAFIVINPFDFFRDLNFTVSDEDAAFIGMERGEDVEILSLVTIPENDPDAMRTNLAGPIVVNVRNRRGKQILVKEYSPRQDLIPESLRREGGGRMAERCSHQQMVAV